MHSSRPFSVQFNIKMYIITIDCSHLLCIKMRYVDTSIELERIGKEREKNVYENRLETQTICICVTVRDIRM